MIQAAVTLYEKHKYHSVMWLSFWMLSSSMENAILKTNRILWPCFCYLQDKSSLYLLRRPTYTVVPCNIKYIVVFFTGVYKSQRGRSNLMEVEESRADCNEGDSQTQNLVPMCFSPQSHETVSVPAFFNFFFCYCSISSTIRVEFQRLLYAFIMFQFFIC